MEAKRLTICFIATMAFLYVKLPVMRADVWVPIKKTEIKSPSGEYLFKIAPLKEWSKHPGYCKGVLFKVDGSKQTEVWSRYLINNVGPVHVFVADSGQYVVTMDEWHNTGTLPVILYGLQGELIKVHNIESLGLEDDIEHIKKTVSSYWWNEDAISFFGPKQEYFFIRLHWGKMLIIELSTGMLYEKITDREMYNKDYYQTEMEKWEKLQSYAKKRLEEISLSYLNSKEPQERSTGALVVGQLKIQKAIPRLKELLRDKEFAFVGDGDEPMRKVYYIRKRAGEALQSMGVKIEAVVLEEVAK